MKPYRAEDFERFLNECKPQIRSYNWLWRRLRASRDRQSGLMKFDQYAELRKKANPTKPLFIGRTSRAIRFLGDVNDYPSALHAMQPSANDHLTSFVLNKLTGREGAYVDVGTNLGVVAATVARAFPERQVIGFEPVPDTAKRAGATFALNRLRNVTLYGAAVGDQDGEIEFESTPGNSAIASVYRHGFDEFGDQRLSEWKPIKVPCVTLDEVVSEIGKVGFVKIDVEGYEPKVAKGMKETMRKFQPDVLFEFSPRMCANLGWRAEDVAEEIASCGPYRFETLEPSGNSGAFPPVAEDTVDIYATTG